MIFFIWLFLTDLCLIITYKECLWAQNTILYLQPWAIVNRGLYGGRPIDHYANY